MKLFEELRVSKFWAGIWPDVNNNFSLAGKTLENLTAELLTQTAGPFRDEKKISAKQDHGRESS